MLVSEFFQKIDSLLHEHRVSGEDNFSRVVIECLIDKINELVKEWETSYK